jgi:hypothetical protein
MRGARDSIDSEADVEWNAKRNSHRKGGFAATPELQPSRYSGPE